MKRNFAQSLSGVYLSIALASTLGACASDRPPQSAAVEYSAQSPFPGAEWTRADPSTLGFSQPGIDHAVAYAQRAGSTSGMLIEHGMVVAQWGDVARKSNLYSARKSFMSALIGIAVERGRIHPDETLAQLGIDDNEPSLTSTEKQATVRMLLEARSGVYHPTVYETAEMEASKPPRGSHEPGTFWYYNNWDFNTLGAIYEKATGQRIFDALGTEIADPIGMQDYRPSDGRYVSGGLATRYPAYPIGMSTRDLARFALLYLHDGRWRDRQSSSRAGSPNRPVHTRIRQPAVTDTCGGRARPQAVRRVRKWRSCGQPIGPMATMGNMRSSCRHSTWWWSTAWTCGLHRRTCASRTWRNWCGWPSPRKTLPASAPSPRIRRAINSRSERLRHAL
jgi:CubicO group peptidase (beta-lactamase class C family)